MKNILILNECNQSNLIKMMETTKNYEELFTQTIQENYEAKN